MKSRARFGVFIALGAAIGVSFHQIGLGVAIGVAIGMLADRRRT